MAKRTKKIQKKVADPAVITGNPNDLIVIRPDEKQVMGGFVTKESLNLTFSKFLNEQKPVPALLKQKAVEKIRASTSPTNPASAAAFIPPKQTIQQQNQMPAPKTGVSTSPTKPASAAVFGVKTNKQIEAERIKQLKATSTAQKQSAVNQELQTIAREREENARKNFDRSNRIRRSIEGEVKIQNIKHVVTGLGLRLPAKTIATAAKIAAPTAAALVGSSGETIDRNVVGALGGTVAAVGANVLSRVANVGRAKVSPLYLTTKDRIKSSLGLITPYQAAQARVARERPFRQLYGRSNNMAYESFVEDFNNMFSILSESLKNK